MNAIKITFIPAKMAHAKTLFLWRNDPETRNQARQRAPVLWKKHKIWLADTLDNPKRQLFLATQSKSEDPPSFLGTIRFDILSETKQEISWTLAPEWRGQGIGKKMVKEALSLVKAGVTVIAEIRHENPASIAVAKHAGFHQKTHDDHFSRWQITL
ncbi:GNAT family N-acetyltransferase [Magnetococcales bacterium HHB-1]